MTRVSPVVVVVVIVVVIVAAVVAAADIKDVWCGVCAGRLDSKSSDTLKERINVSNKPFCLPSLVPTFLSLSSCLDVLFSSFFSSTKSREALFKKEEEEEEEEEREEEDDEEEEEDKTEEIEEVEIEV